ncbi:hypothetical protein [uncultured Microbacterium sp.]|uniref:hypothetical protein n=1 Tax=uncultured Microbacterium sp. TaxID=191216 RepID=UPI0025EFC3E2|nr:hypothetical protein [uncultured Microbacterium sp.]
MSTCENPENPPLTRRQLRELRQTGATPIITPEHEAQARDAAARAEADEVPAAPAEPAVRDDAIAAPSADPALRDEPSEEAETAPPTEHESMPSGDAAAFPEAESAEKDASDEQPLSQGAPALAEPALRPSMFDDYDASADFGMSGLTRRQVRAQEKIRTAAVPIISPDLEPSSARSAAPTPVEDDNGVSEQPLPPIFRPAVSETAENAVSDRAEAPAPSVVNPALGSELLEGGAPEVSLPESFDQLLARQAGSTGAVSTPNALILSQTPTGVPLVGPVTATGEIMITGTFELPEGLGSVGHAPGTTDGRDADAVLLDGELPPASSPTPIAASAAISTVKQPGEIIRPPAPEKGSKLLVGLIITTGALALAVAVTLVLAFTTGVFR